MGFDQLNNLISNTVNSASIGMVKLGQLFPILGIILGLNDIWDGSRDISLSEFALELEHLAKEFPKIRDQLVEIISTMKQSFPEQKNEMENFVVNETLKFSANDRKSSDEKMKDDHELQPASLSK